MKNYLKKFFVQKNTPVKDYLAEKLTFLTIFVSMLIAHLVFFVHNWANEDSLFNIIVEESMIGSGRFMPGNILSKYASPMVLFVIAVIALSLISIILINMFNLKKKSHIVITACLLTTFPVLAISIGYNFMIERYMMGLLLSVLAVFLSDKWKYGFVLGGLCLGLSLGYYQSYITVTITLVIIKIILKLFEEKDMKKIFMYIGKFLGMGILGIGLYFMVVKVIYGMLGIELLDYKGINNIGTIPSIDKWPDLLDKTYSHVKEYLLGTRFFNPGIIPLVFQVILALMNIVLIILTITKNKNIKKANLIMIVLFVIIFPFGMNILDFMMDDVSVSTLNIMQFVFMFILPFILISFVETKIKDFKGLKIIETVCVVCAMGIIWSNFKMTNLYYTKMQTFNEATVLLTNRIYSRIEQVPDVTSETKVFFGNRTGIYNNENNLNIYSDVFLMDQGLWNQYIGYTNMIGYNDYKYHMLMKNLIGLKFQAIPYEEGENIKTTREYESMPQWPQEGSIDFIGDVLVVKLS